MHHNQHVAALSLPVRPDQPLKTVPYNSTKPVIPPKSGKRKQLQRKLQKRQVPSTSPTTVQVSVPEPWGSLVKQQGSLGNGDKRELSTFNREPLGEIKGSENRDTLPAEYERRGPSHMFWSRSNHSSFSSWSTIVVTTPTTPVCKEWQQSEASPSTDFDDSAYGSANSTPPASPCRKAPRQFPLHKKSVSHSSTDSGYHSASEASFDHLSSSLQSPHLTSYSEDEDEIDHVKLPTWQISSPTNVPPNVIPTTYKLPAWPRLEHFDLPRRTPSPASQYECEGPLAESSTLSGAVDLNELLVSAELLAEQYRGLLSSRNSNRTQNDIHLHVPVSVFSRGPTPPPKTAPIVPPKELEHLLSVPFISTNQIQKQLIAQNNTNGAAVQRSYVESKNEYGTSIFRSASAIPEAVARTRVLRRKPQMWQLKDIAAVPIFDATSESEEEDLNVRTESIGDESTTNVESYFHAHPVVVRDNNLGRKQSSARIQRLAEAYEQLKAELEAELDGNLEEEDEKAVEEMNDVVGGWLCALGRK